MAIENTATQDRELAQRPRLVLWAGISFAVILVILGAVWAYPHVAVWASADHSVSSDRLRIGTVVRDDFVRDIAVQGRVVAGVSPTLYAAHTGTVTFDVSVGDRVEEGQFLAFIDSPEVTNRLGQQQALYESTRMDVNREEILTKQKKIENAKNVSVAEMALTTAKREARRAEEAFKGGAISTLDLEKARDEQKFAEVDFNFVKEISELDLERLDFELNTKKLDLERQRLELEDLQRQVEEQRVKSPISGVVGSLLVDQKASVGPNQALLVVVDLTRFELVANVPENYASEMAQGMNAEISHGSDLYRGELVSVSPEVIDGQVSVSIQFVDVPEGLRQNQRMPVRILLEHLEDRLVVQRGPFLDANQGRVAYVVEDGVASRRQIETGARSARLVEIVSGLNEGESIIVSSTDSFRNAKQVLIN